MRANLLTILIICISALGMKAQTYATLPFTDNLTSGTLGSSWAFSDVQGMGTYSITNLSGGWPNFGTCSASKCANVGATGGNGMIIYNSSSPSGSNQMNMDLHLNMAGMGTSELQFAVVDWRSGWDSLAIHLSNDGGSTFTRATMISLWLAPHSDGIWNEVTLDLSALATSSGVSFSSTYVVRFATYLEYSGSATNPKNWPNQSVYYDNFKGTETVPLPVELTSFKGENINGKRALNWTTGAEVNNDYFSIERSLDGQVWESIGTVEGQGNSDVVTNYNFVDESSISTSIYYRLKQVDYDGTVKYSDPIHFSGNTTRLNAFVKNNGSQPTVSVTGTTEQANVKLFSIDGKLLVNNTIQDGQVDALSLENVPSGTYILNVTSGGQTVSKRVSVVK